MRLSTDAELSALGGDVGAHNGAERAWWTVIVLLALIGPNHGLAQPGFGLGRQEGRILEGVEFGHLLAREIEMKDVGVVLLVIFLLG